MAGNGEDFQKSQEAKMEDTALKMFGTPERELRRRLLHPNHLGATWNHEETDDGKEQPNNDSPPVEPPDASFTSLSAAPTYTPSRTDVIIGILYHVTAATFYLYMRLESDKVLATMKHQQNLVYPESEKYGGMWKLLTHINFHVQGGYFILALLCDLLPWATKSLQKFVDFIFTTTVFPCALVVTSMFWFFTVFLRDFSVGAADDPSSVMLDALPAHINHTWHTAVSVGVVVEALLVYHRYSSNSDAIKTMFIWNSSYAFWVYWCFYQADTLPYPLLRNLGPYLMPLFFILNFIVSLFSYFFGKVLALWSWAGEVN